MLFTFYLIITWLNVNLGYSPKLFGGTCYRSFGDLVISGAYESTGKLTNCSYTLDLKKFAVPGSEANWQPDTVNRRAPENVVSINFANRYRRLFYSPSTLVKDFIVPTILFDQEEDRPVTLEKPNSKDSLQLTNRNDMKVRDEEYFEALKDNLRILVYYNDSLFFIENFQSPYLLGQPINVISIYDYNSRRITFNSTIGVPPIFRRGFSATIHYHILYLVGGKLKSDTNIEMIPSEVHTLDLITLRWDTHTVPNFKGYMSGCLYVGRQSLIHAFGYGDGTYISKTQVVNTSNWTLSDHYIRSNGHSKKLKKTDMGIQTEDTMDSEDKDMMDVGSDRLSTIIIVIIVISTIGTLVLLWLVSAHLYRKRIHPLKPPVFIHTPIWSPLKFIFEVDISLTSPPAAYYDTHPIPLGATIDYKTPL